MRSTRPVLLLLFLFAAAVLPGAALGQTLTVYNSGGSYGSALPTTGLTTTIENFAGIGANAPVSTTSPESWRGFSLLAAGTSPWGPSQYCLSLASCLNWTTSPPASPGVYVAVGDPSMGSGELTFTLGARTFAFGLNHWDWNDGGQRSIIEVTLSNGATITVTGPTSNTNDPMRFIGFQLDLPSVYAGIYISKVVWKAIPGQSEIIGIKNVQTSVAKPVLSVTKSSRVWDPAGEHRKAIPGNEVIYTVTVTNSGLAAADSDSVFLVDPLPGALSFWNGDIDDGGLDQFPQYGQVGFSQVNGAAMTFVPSIDLGVSTSATAPAAFAQCTQALPDNNHQSSIRYLCLRPRGPLPAGPSHPSISFSFRARIN